VPATRRSGGRQQVNRTPNKANIRLRITGRRRSPNNGNKAIERDGFPVTHREICARGWRSRSEAKLKACQANLARAQKERAQKFAANGKQPGARS
jgi:hypothetical protein